MPEPDTGTSLKTEGKKSRRSMNKTGPDRKKYTSTVVGLESNTFDVGNAKYAAKFQKSLDVIAIHIQRKYEVGPDVAKAIRDLVLPIVTLPAYLVGTNGNPPDPGEIYLWQQSITEANKRRLLIEDYKKRAYTLVFGQCSSKLISKIKSFDSFARADLGQDIVQMLLIVRGYCCQFDDHQQGAWALENTKHRVSVFYQGYDLFRT